MLILFWVIGRITLMTLPAAAVGWLVGRNLKNYINSFLNYDIKSFVFF